MSFDLTLISNALGKSLSTDDILKYNTRTSEYGLILCNEEAKYLVNVSNKSLEKNGRVELGEGIIGKLILNFSDSPFIFQSNYTETIEELIETFYYYKNETLEIISDDELIDFMKIHFNEKCQGSIELLQNNYLSKLAHNVRYGHPFDYEIDDKSEEEDEEELYEL